MKKPELLAPAGNREMLETACLYGADAVYMGFDGPTNLRAFAGNFSAAGYEDAVSYAHGKGVKVYLTLNIYPHDSETELIKQHIRAAKDAGADAIILSDIGVLSLVKDIWPEAEIHLSTQANTVNVHAVNAWAALGVKRVILARELSKDEIGFLSKNTSADLEMFIHGSVCISISGRCLVSSYLNSRDANRGACTQPCRWEYALMEKTRPDMYMPVAEEGGYTYLYNSKDLCLLPVFGELMGLGLSSLKIEGRNRTPLYVATIVAVYRKAIDAYLNDPESFAVKAKWLDEIKKTSNREYFTGFFTHKPGSDSVRYDFKGYEHSHHLAAKVLETKGDMTLLEARNPLIKGMELELLGSNGERKAFVLENAFTGSTNADAIRPNQIFSMHLDFPALPGELIRKPYSEGDKIIERLR
jgi:putative protease